MERPIKLTKSFLINRSEIEGRADPHQFHIERREAIEKLNQNNEIVKLKSIVKNVKTTTSNISEFDVYIGLENIESNTGEYIPTIDKQSISSAGIFEAGQILFPKLRPYLNKVYLAEFNGLCSTEFHIFKSDKFNNEFLAIYLRSDLIVNQTKHLMTGNTLPRLQTEDINNLPVPNISLDKQQIIVELYRKANSQKQQKETQAQELLKSIDTYLLNELGISLPVKNNSLENRMFTVNFSEVVGGRFDGFEFFNKDNKIEGGVFENIKLRQLAYLVKGQSITSDKIIEGNYPVIAGGQSSPYNHNVFNFEGNIITISASGAYSGYVWFHNYPIFASDCTVVFSKDESKILNLYLSNILKLKQREIYNLQQGAGQPHVYAKDLEKLNIPLPPISKQKEIVNHINDIQEQIQTLQADAKRILDDAKLEVEKMIIA